MRCTSFYVPKRAIKAVANFIGDHEVCNSIEGLTEDGEIIIEVEYEKEQTKVIDSLESLIDSFDNDEESTEEEGEEEETN
jgi:hypothetical protein